MVRAHARKMRHKVVQFQRQRATELLCERAERGAKKRCPDTTLYPYVPLKLKALEKLGCVRLEDGEWVILMKYVTSP
jgi:hypothetical protein